MPHLIEGLGNVKECGGAVLLGIKGCVLDSREFFSINEVFKQIMSIS
jgi:hypothetical protein